MEKKYRATARCFCCHPVLSQDFSQISIGLPTWKKTFILSFSAFLRSCSRKYVPPVQHWARTQTKQFSNFFATPLQGSNIAAQCAIGPRRGLSKALIRRSYYFKTVFHELNEKEVIIVFKHAFLNCQSICEMRLQSFAGRSSALKHVSLQPNAQCLHICWYIDW